MGMALTVPQYTVADLDLLPDDGNRYEVLAGTLLVTPSPGSAHQGVAAGLAALFASHILARRIRLFSPGVVTTPPLTQLEPDLLIVPPRFALGTPWAEIGEHWLAVEILSRSSRVYDREFKARRVPRARRARSVARGPARPQHRGVHATRRRTPHARRGDVEHARRRRIRSRGAHRAI
jgi:Uma2 family endonuclease